MVSLEQGIADAFNKHFDRRCQWLEKRAISASLGGQDEKIGADYVITDTTKFLLIEFKFIERKIKTEDDKPLRLSLCLRLEDDQDLAATHDACHYIGWASRGIEDMRLNVYRLEVCNQRIWPNEAGLSSHGPDQGMRTGPDHFIDALLSRDALVGLDYDSFSSYITILLAIAGSSEGSVTLVVYDDSVPFYRTQPLSSLNALRAWLDANPKYEPPKPP